jgi:hypothetical protein
MLSLLWSHDQTYNNTQKTKLIKLRHKYELFINNYLIREYTLNFKRSFLIIYFNFLFIFLIVCIDFQKRYDCLIFIDYFREEIVCSQLCIAWI